MREFVKHIHFVGLGGIGMSGIAEVLLDQGYKISGSDLNDGPVLQRLAAKGAITLIGHAEENIQGADVVVVSSAVAESNPEVMAAREQKIPVVPRAEMLAELMRFRQGIAIAGTHGKTTTTSLVSDVLIKAGLDPTFVIGGIVASQASNARLGSGEILVAEADESDASFLQLTPMISAITNIDSDHMETYGNSFEQLKQTFVQFIHQLPFYGLAIICNDDPVVREIAGKLNRRTVTFGLSDGAEIQAVNLRQRGLKTEFEVIRFGEHVGHFTLSMPGQHNVLNALVAISVAHQLGLKDEDVRSALAEFKGIGRRFEQLGKLKLPGGGKVEVIDDYAHHPRELAATFAAAGLAWPDKRIVCLFQPHRYSRTEALLDDFAQVLSSQPNLILLEVYPAGEQSNQAADGRALSHAIRARGGEVVFSEDFKQATTVLLHQLQDKDVLLCLGAGDIGRYARTIVREGLCTP
ncbi:MAG: UDP-N-acetylmuramate--L-alanine ligase [Proteobacteria bacterium]|nr:UDP-N-acetylmuramate--L-alanine ligase [Pseudomonadota bacterium]